MITRVVVMILGGRVWRRSFRDCRQELGMRRVYGVSMRRSRGYGHAAERHERATMRCDTVTYLWRLIAFMSFIVGS